MKKYIEQRVEELELDLKLLKAKLKLKESATECTNYQKRNITKDYLYNPSLNIISNPNPENSFHNSFDNSKFKENTGDKIISTNLNNLNTDEIHSTFKYIRDSYTGNDLTFQDYPDYPDIIGSFDEYGFKLNFHKEAEDKDFLEWIKTEGKRIYNISKNIDV